MNEKYFSETAKMIPRVESATSDFVDSKSVTGNNSLENSPQSSELELKSLVNCVETDI